MEILRIKVITKCPYCLFKTWEDCSYCDNAREMEREVDFATFIEYIESEINPKRNRK